MASISGCAKADEADLVGQLTPIIGVGDKEDTVAELIEWPRLKGSRVEYPTGFSQFREFCKAKSSIDEIWGHAFAYKAQFDYGLTLPLSNLAKSAMNLIGDCPAQLICNFLEVILVCETLNRRWAASGSEKRITAKDFLEYYVMKYVTATDGRSDEEPLELNNITITKEINCKVSRKESFIDVVAREGTELEAVLKELEISRLKRVASKDDKVRRSKAKRRLAGKTLGSMEEKLSTPKLNTPLKLARLNEILDGPVNMATVSSTVVRNLTKRKAVKRGAAPRSISSEVLEESDKIVEGADLRSRLEVEAGLLEEQCRAKARDKMVAIMDDEFKKVDEARKGDFPARGGEKLVGREPDYGEGSFPVGAEKEREAAALKLKEVRAESEAEAERLKVEEREDGLNVAEKTAVDNQETINQEIESLRLRVVDLEGLLEVEKKFSTELQKEPDVAREREEQTLLYNAEYAEEYEVLFSQYEDRLDDNVKLSLKLKEAKRQVEQKNTTILNRDLTLNQLTSELAELKEKATPGSRYEAELDRVKADLRRLKGRDAQSRADLAEIQAKKKSLVDDLAHARRNVRRAVQRENEMNERINQLCARISESDRELRVREMKYQKDLKFELDKRDGEIASGEGSREMKEFLHRKEELVENMRIDLTNSRQKSILTRQMNEHIDQLTAELAETKARRLKDNKRAAITHQAFKELVERDLMQDCFSGRTCVYKLDISSIDPIDVMDRGIGTTTAEQIARGREIIAEKAPEYMASRTEIGGSSSVVSPTPVVGRRPTALPSRKSC
ncbi:hypothetical protein GIB67_038823 [Kingdonia uniflora]|uniref:Uncharacterized protein n=1 Tax=Kingdonia uniflora TaxID=39325 RepID=A0A7J7M112_9MAGN|nr:hypothetical protein GIB67_038823 [Kingdonia uniflora]